jgi:hypothetical protein
MYYIELMRVPTYMVMMLPMLRRVAFAIFFLCTFVDFPSTHAQQPGASSQVVSIFPNFGSFDGSTSVTLTGSGFVNSWTVCKFGSIAQ